MLGLPILMHPDVRSWRWPAKIAAAFATGAIVLAVESTLLTLLRVPWNAAIVAAPPLLLAVFLASRSRTREVHRPQPFRPGRGVGIFVIVVATVTFLYLGLALVAARATSADFPLFWGVKAVRFAAAKALDPALLRWPFFAHAQPFYPPLVPVLDAWSVMLAGRMPWRTAPLVELLWFGAAIALLLESVRARIGDRNAALVTGFWTAALGASLAVSFSAASGEAPLLLYETAGGALLMTEDDAPSASRRFLAGLFLAGAVLTKVEGSVGAALLIFGAILRDLSTRRLRWRSLVPLVLAPASVGLLWAGFLWRFGIQTTYMGRGHLFEPHWDRLLSVLASMAGQLRAGTWWLSWILPLVVILVGARRPWPAEMLPGVVAIAGLMVFFAVIYLHEPGDAANRIGWELPRVSQPALSLLILVAAVSTMPRPASPVRIR